MNKRTKETKDINYINGMQLLYLKKGQPTRKLCWYFSKLKYIMKNDYQFKLAMNKLYFITALITIKNISWVYKEFELELSLSSSLNSLVSSNWTF